MSTSRIYQKHLGPNLSASQKRNKLVGFTLVEMLMVIVILGIVSIGVSDFMRLGFGIYADAGQRESMLNKSRFAVERLNRELRAVIPNSVRVAANATSQQCIEFIPFKETSSYLTLPVDEADNSAKVIRHELNAQNSVVGDLMAIYPTQTSDLYSASNKVHEIESILYETNTLTMGFGVSDIQFDTHSPQRRYYTFNNAVSYCFSVGASNDGELRRYEYANLSATQPLPADFAVAGVAGVLMAQGMSNDLTNGEFPFKKDDIALNRNAIIELFLKFDSSISNESMFFYNEVHLPNVP